MINNIALNVENEMAKKRREEYLKNKEWMQKKKLEQKELEKKERQEKAQEYLDELKRIADYKLNDEDA